MKHLLSPRRLSRPSILVFLLLIFAIFSLTNTAPILTSTVIAAEVAAAKKQSAIATELRTLIKQGNAAAIVRTYNAWVLRGLPQPMAALPLIPYRDNDHPIFRIPGVQPIPPGRGLLRLLREQGFFTANQVRSPLFEARDEAALARTLFMRAVARQVTRGANDDATRAVRLFAFVLSEVQPNAKNSAAAWPEDILIRGWGSCDQSAWVLARLAEQVGIKSLIIFLRAPHTRESYHTIAALRVTGRWQPYDTFAALDFRQANAPPPNLLAALTNPQPLDAFRQSGRGECLLNPHDLPWSDFLVYSEVRGALLRWAQFRDTATGTCGESFHFWVNPIWRAKSLRIELAKTLGGQERDLTTIWKRFSTDKVVNGKAAPIPQVRVFPYGEPFSVEKRYANPIILQEITATRAYGKFRQARRRHLLGNSRAALEILTKLPRKTSELTATGEADRRFYAALAYLSMGQPRKSLSLFSEMKKAAKAAPFWLPFIAWHEARAHVTVKDFPAAVTDLKRVLKPRIRAASRWQAVLMQP